MFALWPGEWLNFSNFKIQRLVSWDNARLRKPATSQTQTLCTMPRDSVVATRIGTFACHTLPRDTKASKRANLPALDLKSTFETLDKRPYFDIKEPLGERQSYIGSHENRLKCLKRQTNRSRC
jgi:hypothetical protein